MRTYRQNHVLEHIRSSGDPRLLKHPLVLHLLNIKWKAYGRMLYFTDLIFYLLFTIMLNVYAFHLPPPSMFSFDDPECPKLRDDIFTSQEAYKFYRPFQNLTDKGCSVACAAEDPVYMVLSIILTVLLGIRVLYEVKEMAYHRELYMRDVMNYMEMILYGCTLWYIWGDALHIAEL